MRTFENTEDADIRSHTQKKSSSGSRICGSSIIICYFLNFLLSIEIMVTGANKSFKTKRKHTRVL